MTRKVERFLIFTAYDTAKRRRFLLLLDCSGEVHLPRIAGIDVRSTRSTRHANHLFDQCAPKGRRRNPQGLGFGNNPIFGFFFGKKVKVPGVMCPMCQSKGLLAAPKSAEFFFVGLWLWCCLLHVFMEPAQASKSVQYTQYGAVLTSDMNSKKKRSSDKRYSRVHLI